MTKDPMFAASSAVLLALSASGCAVLAPPRAAEPWEYDVTIADDGREALVRVRPPRGARLALRFEGGGEMFAHDRAEAAGEFRYRYALADASDALDSMNGAIAWDSAQLASTSVWLAHPSARVPFTLRVRGPFASGLPRAGSGEWLGIGLQRSPFAALGPWRMRTVRAGDANITVAIAPSHFAADDDAIARWVETTAAHISSLYGRFPLPQTLIAIVPQDGRVFATTTGGGAGGSILMPISAHATAQALEEEWALTHEMLHLAFPSVAAKSRWIDEGLATYAEPLVRARAGMLTPEEVWRDILQDGRDGLPTGGDHGLEGTTVRERIYWGGALFWLSVDVAVRDKTRGARSIEDAMRAVLASGGNVSDVWDIGRIVATCDRALDGEVVRDHYVRLGLAPGRVDLDGLAKRLGVTLAGDSVAFDEKAPLAWIRRALTARR